jgi:hypothetical protein
MRFLQKDEDSRRVPQRKTCGMYDVRPGRKEKLAQHKEKRRDK